MAQAPDCQQLLDQLYQKRASLLGVLTSGVQEIEQPQLGRTLFRKVEELETQLRIINQQISNLEVACGVASPTGVDPARKVRRPIYPVVTEI